MQYAVRRGDLFQPFLRFNKTPPAARQRLQTILEVSTLLEIQPHLDDVRSYMFEMETFQPFLRFNGSCIRFLWVFKFFFGFL